MATPSIWRDGKDPAEGCAHGETLAAPCALGGWNPPVRPKPSWDRLENPAGGWSLEAGVSLSLQTTAESVPKMTRLWGVFSWGEANNCETRQHQDTPGPGGWSDRTHSNALSVPCTEMLSPPMLTPSQTHVLENGTFNLTCNSSLSADTLLWLRNMTYLATDQRLELSPGNRTLTMLKVTRGDAGAYQCEVRNPISTNRSEPTTTGVRHGLFTWGSLTDGPDSASIDLLGPITLGSPLTLMCVTDSVPPSHYLWLHNGTDANETGSRWTINPMTWDQQGTFVCQAHNPDTNLTAQASVTVRGTSLSAGAIAGIVIGSLAGAALVGGLFYFLLCKTGG
uniref:Ig-like domain-containing protein n=1 Tax=Pelusios castaneus TaxID=367368 RepID=A0A8C8RH44_9SAUR